MNKLFTKTASVAMGLCLAGTAAIGQNTIFDIVAGSPNHTILETALIQQGLNTTLSDANVNYTLFAPTDSAFNVYLNANNLTAAQLLANTELTNILLHHVLGSEVFAAGLSSGEVTTLNGLDVTVNLSGGAKIDSAPVLTADLDASNGVVHSIGGVLLPTYDDVTEVVAKSANHTTLLAALQQANLVTTLQDLSKSYTVFAPTNAAFDAYLAANNLTAAQLLAAPNLSEILLQHVLGVKAVSSGLTNGEVTTLHGKDVTVDITSGVKIDAATVTTADIEAGNGVVHVIDGVLLPTYDDVTEVVSLSADHTTLLAALQQANLVTTLQDLSKSYTVFAPTNAAFDAYLAANNLTAAQLLAAPNLSEILLQHVLGVKSVSSGLTNGEVTTLHGKDVTVDITSGVKIDAATVTTADIEAGNGVVHVIDGVLLPTYDDVTEVVSLSADHTTLLAALQQANLVTTLQDLSKSYTVFAPTNAAFDAYLAANNLTAAQLLAAPNLSEILLQHVLGVKAVSSGLTNGEVTTLHGKDVTVDITSGVKIDAATVTTADIEAGNGVVHVIDGVLLPTYDDVTEVVSLSADHTTLLAALQQANLVTTLQDLSKSYTVFAPTNAAFDAYLAANNLTAAQLLAAPNLSNILLNHVLGSEVLAAALTNGPVKTLNGTDVVVDITSGVKIDAATVTTADIKAGNGAVHVLDAVLSINAATNAEAIEGSALIKLFPNPTTNYITLENVTTGEVVNILNMQGQLVKSVVLSQASIDVSDLPSGNYLIRSFSAVASFIKK